MDPFTLVNKDSVFGVFFKFSVKINCFAIDFVDENNSNNLEDSAKDPAPFIDMGEDSKELTEEDFDFSGAFKMSEPLPGAKSEKGRNIWVYK